MLHFILCFRRCHRLGLLQVVPEDYVGALDQHRVVSVDEQRQIDRAFQYPQSFDVFCQNMHGNFLLLVKL